MPLLDHFHPPLSRRHPWDSFRLTWAATLASALNQQWLPNGYFADAMVFPIDRHLAPPEGALTNWPNWTPPASTLVMPAVFPTRSEVLIFSHEESRPLAAILLVIPEYKQTPGQRRAFAARCASYLGVGTHMILMDVVTEPQGNLHNEVLRILQADEAFRLPAVSSPYAVSYRAVVDHEKPEVHLWPATFAVGDRLPAMPLEVTEELVLSIDFEATYTEACRSRRLFPPSA
jgi:hypothetical protein